MKKIMFSVLSFIFVFLLAGCGEKKNNIPEENTVPDIPQATQEKSSSESNAAKETQGETTTKDPVKIDLSGNSSGKQETGTEKQTEPPIDDILADMEGMPFQGSALFLSPDDTECFSPLIYTGGDFVFYYQSGSTENKKTCIGFTLNGVYQDIKLEYDGKITDYAIRHTVELKAGKSTVFKVYLRPNIGKAGDVLQFRGADVSKPDLLITEPDKMYSNSDVSLTCFLPTDFEMQADSTQSVSICSDYENVTIGRYGKNLKDHFNYINSTDDLCQLFLYNELEKNLYIDKDDNFGDLYSRTIIDAGRTTKFPIHIAMSGKSGTTQRISVYVNNEIQPVFNGKYYADVHTEYKKQTTVDVYIDTSKLSEWNNIYVVAHTLDAAKMDACGAHQSEVYVLRVR